MRQTNRRQWLRGMTAGTLWSAVPFDQASAADEYQLFWGDLHNHNAVGYAQGSLERTYEIATSHLDFIAFTPHAQWHDMPEMPNNAHQKWVKGFQVLSEQWPKVQKMAAAYNHSGKFVSFLAYEWHSSYFGDYCLYYRDDHQTLRYFDHVRELQKYAREARATIIPHHLGYKQGWRGANWEYLDPTVSPVLEIYSEHGLAEFDRGPGDYITHSNGGRWTRNTLQAALRKGFRLGVIASSDDHLGFPGAYGEGIAGIYAKDLSREALLEALWARRTLAATGDRIALIARLNRQWMGSVIAFTADREIEVSVTGGDEIEHIDILKNGRVIHRHFPEDHIRPNSRWSGEALCRLEFGWGPWAALGMDRVCDWEASVTIHDGKLRSVTPCFQSGPFDEQRQNRIVARAENTCRFQLYTSRNQAFRERATNAVVLHLSGSRSSVLELTLSRPASMTFRKTLGELAENNEIEFTGRFTSESFVVHRLVTPDLFRASFRVADRGRRGQTDWYYARVVQVNGHQAWSSPIWVEG